MDEDELRANEQAVADRIEDTLRSIALDSVSAVISVLLGEPDQGYRYVTATAKVHPDTLGSTRANFESQLNVRKRVDDATSKTCLLYTSPSPRDQRGSRMPSSA